MPKDAVQAAVAAAARAGGFKGGPRTWRMEVPLGLAVLNLQKSQWGPQYYVNFGLYVRSLGVLPEPRAEQCHYYARAERVDPSQEQRWKELLDLERPIEESQRRREIEAFLSVVVVPFLTSLGSDEGLRAAHADGRLTQGARVELQQYLVRPTDLEPRLALLRAATSGILTELSCPTCALATVSVRFTHPAPEEYRTWFVCSSCKFEMRTQDSGKPPHFAQGLIDLALEERDRR